MNFSFSRSIAKPALTCAGSLWLALVPVGEAIAAAPFTYQGRLNASGGPAAGNHDFEFGLYSSSTGAGQIGTTVTLTNVAVTGGLFSVQLDFGDAAFDGGNRWLELGVRPTGPGAFTGVAPRQVVSPSPAAHVAYSVADGSVTSAKLAPGAVVGGPAGTVLDGSITGHDLAPGAVTGAALAPEVAQSLAPAASFVMTTSTVAPAGYRYTGTSVSPNDVGEWSTSVPLPAANSTMATCVLDGKIHVIGGTDGYYGIDTHHVFDPETGTWSTKAPLPVARYSPTASVVNGKIYVVGGGDGYYTYTPEVLEYDAVGDSWVTRASMLTPRVLHVAAVIDNKIYVTGGYKDDGGYGETAWTTEVYDPALNTWTAKADHPAPAFGMAGAAHGGLLYTFGGSGNSLEVQVYNPAWNSWSSRGVLPNHRVGASCQVLNGKFYIVGGYDNNWNLQALGFKYDPDLNKYTPLALLPTPRGYLGTAAAGGKIYAFGGNIGNYVDTNEVFTPADEGLHTLYVHQKL